MHKTPEQEQTSILPSALEHEGIFLSRAATAERLITSEITYPAHEGVQPEVYAHATQRLAELGGVAVEGFVEDLSQTGAYREVWVEFWTAIEENLTTDEEFGDRLKFDPLREYGITGGHVVDQRGNPVVEVVAQGLEASRQAAEDNPRMKIQVERDTHDVEVAKTVDTLAVGEMYAVISHDPRTAIRADRKFWETKMGYREGMSVLQVYFRVDQDHILAGAYSIKHSDDTVMKQLLEEHGAVVPDDLDENNWTSAGLRLEDAEGVAYEFGKTFQREHQRRIKATQEQVSVTELMLQNSAMVEGYFKQMMIPLARARYSGRTESVLQELAGAVMDIESLSAEEKRHAMRIANSSKFSVADARFMEGLIRYAAVEELRKNLPAMLGQSQAFVSAELGAYSGNYQPETPIALIEQTVANIEEGRAAGRSYGGCAPAGEDGTTDSESLARQDIFGGKTRDQNQEEGEDQECEYSGTFCYCCPYNIDGTLAPKLVEITARRSPNGVAECLRPGCGATLDEAGNARKGRIYERAMRLKNDTQKVA